MSSNVLSRDVVAALDRSKLSNSKAAMVLCAVANALGHNIIGIPLSIESIRKARLDARESFIRE